MKQRPRETSSYQALLALVKLGGVLRKAGDRYLGAYGLTQCQFNVLMVLKHHYPAGCTQTELCRRLLVNGSNMTTLVRRVEARGLIRRGGDPDDERAWRVELTDKGARLFQQVERVYYRWIASIMAVHSDRERKRLFRQLERTREAIARQAV
jgi:DNA-binding MarR family transcriptional regulator